MVIPTAFDLASALRYGAEGRQAEWVEAFLTRSDRPNLGLWERIVERSGFWVGPIEVSLRDLMRCFAPVQERVDGIAHNLRNPMVLPPLIVHSRIHQQKRENDPPRTTFIHQLDIADGNHRHAALEAIGSETCWAIVELGTEHLE